MILETKIRAKNLPVILGTIFHALSSTHFSPQRSEALFGLGTNIRVRIQPDIILRLKIRATILPTCHFEDENSRKEYSPRFILGTNIRVILWITNDPGNE